MTDIARLGFSAETSSLKDAKATLDALVPSAQRAAGAADRFNKATAGVTNASSGAAAGIKSFAAAAAGAATFGDKLNRATLMSGTGLRTVQAAAMGATAPLNNLVATTARVGTTFRMADAHVTAYKATLAAVPAAANGATSSLARLGAAANDNINRLQSTPGNIAAQFQDIGVTAAGGMNPLLIALQQGTQLSSAMAGGLTDVLDGFRQLFSVTTVLTIGLVALVATGLQMVDWMAAGQAAVRLLADGMDALAGFITESSEALIGFILVAAVAFGPRIVASVIALSRSIIIGLVTAIRTATLAMITFSLANPFGAVVIAIGLVIAAMSMLNDRFGGVFTNILSTVRTVANGIIRYFAMAFNTVLQYSDKVANGIISAFNAVTGFLGLDVNVGSVDSSAFQIDTRSGRDFVGEIGSAVGGLLSSGASFARGLLTPSAPSTTTGSVSGAAAGGGQTETDRQTEAYSQLVSRMRDRIAALDDEVTAMGMAEVAGRIFLAQQELLRDAASQGIRLDRARREELMRLAQAMVSTEIAKSIADQTRAYEEQIKSLADQADLIGLAGRELVEATTFQKMFNDAVSEGIIDADNMTDSMQRYVSTLRERASFIADATEANRNLDFMTEADRNLESQIEALIRQRGEIGLTGPVLEAYRIESELINRALRENIALTPQNISQIRQQAVDYAVLNDEIRRQREWTELTRNSVRGFFGDMVNNLQQGQNAWQAFGSAVMNVVNRIIDRLLDLGTESLFSGLRNLVSGGLSLQQSSLDTIAANPEIFAKGGAFDNGVQKFAKGGAFTNGVYNSPTLFKFAKGGAFGVMAEAGPEAVMPLKRGSDGSLGVQVQASEPQTVLVRIVTDDERFDAYVDGRISANAPEIAQAGAMVGERERSFKNSRRLA